MAPSHNVNKIKQFYRNPAAKGRPHNLLMFVGGRSRVANMAGDDLAPVVEGCRRDDMKERSRPRGKIGTLPHPSGTHPRSPLSRLQNKNAIATNYLAINSIFINRHRLATRAERNNSSKKRTCVLSAAMALKRGNRAVARCCIQSDSEGGAAIIRGRTSHWRERHLSRFDQFKLRSTYYDNTMLKEVLATTGVSNLAYVQIKQTCDRG